jgi:hypothetical protein
MTYELDIELNDPLEAAIDDIIGEVEEAIENIRKYHEPRLMHQVDVDIDELLAEHQAIGIVWDIQHVKDQRPELTDDQAWEVLHECQRTWERLNDPMLEAIRQVAGDLFPQLKGKAALRAHLIRIERRIEALPEDECTDPAAYGSVGAELDTIATRVAQQPDRRPA